MTIVRLSMLKRVAISVETFSISTISTNIVSFRILAIFATQCSRMNYSTISAAIYYMHVRTASPNSLWSNISSAIMVK